MKNRLLYITVLLLLAVSMYAQSSTNAIKQKLESSFAALSSLQADVQQTNYFAQIKQTIRYDGKIYYEPSRMLIRFDKPHLQRLMIQGSEVQLYDAQSRSMLTSELLPEFSRMNPLQILQHYWDKSKVSIVEEKGKVVSLRLDTAKDSFVRQINAKVNLDSGMLMELSYKDHSENTVSYRFSNLRTGHKIDSKVWSFNPPKDTQHIRR